MRLIILTAIGLLAACQQPAEERSANEAEGSALNSAEGTANTAAPVAPPPTREAALKLMHDRHEKMEEIGDATKVLGRETKKDQPDLAAVRTASATIARLAPQVPSWFPAGTGPDVGKTDSLPAIWEKPEDFAAKSRHFDAAAKAMNAAATAGDTAGIKAAFGDLGKSCKACHDPYRAKDD